jgi:glycosyltransferase involved in cell wall biosynthesis
VCIWNQRSDGSDADALNITYSARLAARLATAFVSNSVAGERFLKRRFNVAGEHSHVVHNGVRLAPPARSPEQWRESLGVDRRTFVATMVANLHPPKDHATLLRAWRIVVERLAGSGRSVLLALAGRPVSTHMMLRHLTEELELEGSVRFLGAVEDVNGLLHASDLAVFSSLYEGMPNGVLESMAAGLVVVSTDLPGVRDAVGPEGGEWLVPIADPVALAEKILVLIGEEALRTSLGERNRRRVTMEFNETTMADRYAAIVRRYIGGSRNG